MATPAVVLEQVTKTFAHVTAVDGISASVPTGCVYGVLGANGAGKTTTIRMIVGILRPDRGRLSVLDETEPRAIKRRLGYLPEEKGLYKKMRVLELVTYFGRLKGMPRAAAKAAGAALLEQFGLAQWQDQKCESLSKGMGQKVQIVGTLIHTPDLIVLDEPFSGLDPVNVELVREIILAQKAANRTVILSTHVMEQAEQICDSILLINRGRKLVDGAVDEVRQATERTVIVDYDGDGSILAKLPGVLRVNDAGRHAELSLSGDADTNRLLLTMAESLTIHRFDTRAASLHEVFVRNVRADNAR